jgi:hypothetical protein
MNYADNSKFATGLSVSSRSVEYGMCIPDICLKDGKQERRLYSSQSPHLFLSYILNGT